MKFFSIKNNGLATASWGVFSFCFFSLVSFGLFLIGSHLSFKRLSASAALLAAALHPTLQLGVFLPDVPCFMKVPAEVNTSLTNFTSSLKKHFLFSKICHFLINSSDFFFQCLSQGSIMFNKLKHIIFSS